MVVNAAFLVARERLEEFDVVVEIAREARGRTPFVLLGPMPAYGFLDTPDPSWA